MIPISRPLLGQEEYAAIQRVVASGMIVQGPEVEAFEHEFSAWVRGRHCVAVSSGTAALHLGMHAAGIGPGDQVIVPSFSFAASANAVRLCGAEPIFVDIEPQSYCLNPKAVDAAITDRTAAIMPVHLYGHPAAMRDLEEVATRYGLALIEDAAQAHGARLHGTPAGAFGVVAAFSFYATKNMTTGEGGMIVTSDPAIARQARLLRNQGMAQPYHNEIVGYNARMTDIAAAIGRVQLTKLSGWTAARRANAARLTESLVGVQTPHVAEGAEHAYHQYTVRCEDRDGLLRRLADVGVGAGIYYPVPIHRMPSFSLDVRLEETERAVEQVLSLPIHPALTSQDLETIVEGVNG